MMQDMETRTLEMLAVAMSEEYSVTVVCNGQSAETTFSGKNGRAVITIPSVPIYDKHYRALLRGYVDHEVGHVRFTDRALSTDGPLRWPHMAGSLQNIWQILEDVYIERGMGECFPGCRRNLRTLSTLLYVEHDSAALPPPLEPVDADDIMARVQNRIIPLRDLPYSIWAAMTQYVLFRVRSEAMPKLKARLPLFREALDKLAPGLADELEPVLARVPAEGVSTEANLLLAKEIIETAYAFFEKNAKDGGNVNNEMLSTLKWIIRNGGRAKESVDLARAAELMVFEAVNNVDQSVVISSVTIRNPVGSDVWKTRIEMLSDEEQKEALQSSAKMEAQMQALLQSFELNRSGPTRSGRLNTNALHKLYTCRNDIFFRHVDKRGVNTEVVLCIDMSGSMHFDDKALLASKALYSLAHSLYKIRGLAFSIIGFFDNQVVDILRTGSRVTPRMRIVPNGGTLCGCALKFAIQTFSAKDETRKIVIMLTDGDANDSEEFEKAIARARKGGVEFLGVGIQDEHILSYLPEDECCIIVELKQLAGEILRMLRKKLGIEE